jgi:drug/metabolite transporter (DMT)-like permease
MTFAGLRYVIAFMCLLPFALTKKNIIKIKKLKKPDMKKLIVLGIIFYSVTQGAQFLGLSLLPAVTVSLLLNFTPVIVAAAALFFLNEIPTGIQWIGTVLFMAGTVLYFFPVDFSSGQIAGLIVMAAGVSANAASSVLGRSINRTEKISPLIVTVISMGIGSFLLLVTGVIIEETVSISLTNAGYLLWLAVINTALAFTLWNKTLRTLTAMESSIINGTMLIQIAILAWLFIDEPVSLKEGIGMLIAAIGAVLVQLKFKSFLSRSVITDRNVR